MGCFEYRTISEKYQGAEKCSSKDCLKIEFDHQYSERFKENILILVIIQNENGLILIFSNKVQHNYVVTFQNNLKNSQTMKNVQ